MRNRIGTRDIVNREGFTRRRTWVVLIALSVVAVSPLLSGCAEDDSVESGPVARVGDLTLTVDRMAELLVLAQPFPLDSAAASGMARHWVSAAAFAGLDDAADPTGDDATRAAVWLEEREALLGLDLEDRLGPTVVVDRLVAEVAFRVGDVRLFAHVLRRVGPETPPEERDLQRRTAERLLQGLVSGGSWDAAVEESDDLDTRATSGLLGLFAQGELGPALEPSAFALLPGQVSSVVEAPDGFHILYRPTFADVAGLFANRLRSRQLIEADQLASPVVLDRRGFSPASGAEEAVRRLAADPWPSLESTDAIATWDTGELEAGVVARYLVALPEDARAELAGADAQGLEGFIREVGLRDLRLDDAGRRGLRLDEAESASFAEQHRAEVAAWRAQLGQDGSATGDLGRSLDAYMEEVVARRTEPLEISPLFEAWLLEDRPWRVDGASIRDAVSAARRMIGGGG